MELRHQTGEPFTVGTNLLPKGEHAGQLLLKKNGRDLFATGLKSLTGQIAFGLRLHQLLLAKSATVVAFHRVNGNTTGRDGLTCSIEVFKEWCRFFSRHFRVIPLAGVVTKLKNGAPFDHELVITFDDGYRDNYEYAAPVLKEMGLPATFFIVSQFMGTDFLPWWDKAIGARHPWMTWNQVQELHREGFEIGNHTRTHADMGKVSGERAWQEILHSRLELEDQISAPVELFAYPYGGRKHMTADNREMVKAAGFRCCCSCFGGVNRRGLDPFHLLRIPISAWFSSPHHLGCDLIFRRA